MIAALRCDRHWQQFGVLLMLAKVLTIGAAISILVAPALAQGSGSGGSGGGETGPAGAAGSAAPTKTAGGTGIGTATNGAGGNETTPAAQSGTRPAHNRHLNRPKTPSGGATNTSVPSPTPQ